MQKSNIIVITGSTATGKSSLGIYLAKKFNGEIISADSRQIYNDLENFTGAMQEKDFSGIRHHLLSFIHPNELFTASDFKNRAEALIEEITKKGKTPIIVGGTAFYIKSLLYKNFIPKVQPNEEFRRQTETMSLDQLTDLLKEKSEQRHSQIDLKNRRRVVRSLEIINQLGYFPRADQEPNEEYNFKLIELHANKEFIDNRIEKNFISRLPGMLNEALEYKDIISENRFNELGLAYKNIYKLWTKEISKEEFTKLGIREEQKYAKRQKTFLNKLLLEFPGKKKRLDISKKFLKLKTYIFIRFGL